jgi:hypothetical protein
MNTSHLIELLVVMGNPRALIADYLDTALNPSIDGYYDYAHEEENNYNAQSCWDALQSKSPVFSSNRIEGCYMLLNQVRRGS